MVWDNIGLGGLSRMVGLIGYGVSSLEHRE